MSKIESGIRQIPYPQQRVYDMLSDLTNIEKVKDRLPEDKVKDITFDKDSVSISVAPVGSVTMQIINREEPKCIKFETTNSPLPFNFWIQILPVTDETSKMRLTIKADVNPFMAKMVEKPLKDGIEKIADVLSIIKYE